MKEHLIKNEFKEEFALIKLLMGDFDTVRPKNIQVLKETKEF